MSILNMSILNMSILNMSILNLPFLNLPLLNLPLLNPHTQPRVNPQLRDLLTHLLLGGGHLRPRVITQIGCLPLDQCFYASTLALTRGGDFLLASRVATQNITHPLVLNFTHRLVEQLQLQDAVFDQLGDLGLGDGGDVMEPGLRQGVDLTTLDHPSVAHEGNPLTAKSLGRLLDLGSKRLRIGGIALKDLCRHRLTGLVTQQPDHDLQLALLLVPVIAISRRLVLQTLQVAAGDVIEEQLRLAVASPGGEEPSFDLFLLMT